MLLVACIGSGRTVKKDIDFYRLFTQTKLDFFEVKNFEEEEVMAKFKQRHEMLEASEFLET